MRNAAIAAAVLTVVVVTVVYVAVARPESSVVPTATPNASASVTASPSTPARTASLGPSPTASGALAAVTMQATRTTVPADVRYVEAWPGRIVTLDLTRRAATELATYTAPYSGPGYPGAQLSASADGRTLLVLVLVSQTDGTLFVLRPETGEVRLIMRGALERAVLSADGSRFAVARHDPDPRLTGLSVGAIADGTMRRLIADDPQLVGSPPVPLAFSTDGQLLAFGLGMGDTGYRGGVMPVAMTEVDAGRLRDPSATTPGVTLLDAASGAEFISQSELFVWSSRTVFGGQTVAYAYDMTSKKKLELYRPTGDLHLEAAWRPSSNQFATLEQPSCCGVGIPPTAWLRGRDGSAKKLVDASPFVGQMWWSRDGTKLYGTTGGDDSTGGVIELLTGQSVMGFCKRGGVAPGSCT